MCILINRNILIDIVYSGLCPINIKSCNISSLTLTNTGCFFKFLCSDGSFCFLILAASVFAIAGSYAFFISAPSIGSSTPIMFKSRNLNFFIVTKPAVFTGEIRIKNCFSGFFTGRFINCMFFYSCCFNGFFMISVIYTNKVCNTFGIVFVPDVFDIPIVLSVIAIIRFADSAICKFNTSCCSFLVFLCCKNLFTAKTH